MDPTIVIAPVEAFIVAIAIPNDVPSAVNGTGMFLLTGGLHHLVNVNTVLPFANDVEASLTFI